MSQAVQLKIVGVIAAVLDILVYAWGLPLLGERNMEIVGIILTIIVGGIVVAIPERK